MKKLGAPIRRQAIPKPQRDGQSLRHRSFYARFKDQRGEGFARIYKNRKR